MTDEITKTELLGAQTKAEAKQKAAEAKVVAEHLLRVGGTYAETNQLLQAEGLPEVEAQQFAKTRRRQLLDDPAFQRRYLAGEREALDQMAGLDYVIAATTPDPTKLP